MHAPRFISASLTLFASSAAVLFVSSASAAGNTCALDTDCPKGFSCQVIGASGGCASAPCEPGTICPPVDCPPPTEIKGCMPGPCATDADCATGMVCYTYTQTFCSETVAPAPSCPPNTVCPDPAPQPSGGGCTTSQSQQCVPRYSLPCTVDFDCGDGFTCVHDQECSGGGVAGGVPTPAGDTGSGSAGSSGSSSGSSGTGTAGTSGTTPPSSGSGDVPPPPPPTCTTLPTAHCELKNTTCQTNADCPSQWTCEQMITGGGMTCAGMAPTDPSIPPPPPICTTTPTVTVSQCQPPYYNLGFRGAQDGTANLGTTETGTTRNGTAGTTGGTPPTSGGPTGGGATYNDPNVSGAGGSSNTGTGTSANHAANGTNSQDSGGCQVALSHTSSSGTALLGLLGFLGLSRRRRSRAA